MQDVDVCIIGGGIQGCGVAQAAAAAGYKTVLLEQSTLASATSSRSSKLIHGGLRYLESAQFSLVAKSLAERERLLRNAPDLIRRVPFYIPIYKQTQRRPWQVALGLSLYALLGRLHPFACFHKLEQQKWSQLDGLKQDGLQAVYQYWDAQTDDAELTRAVMHSALQLDASLLCPARFSKAVYQKDRYQVDYLQGETASSLSCKVLINAAGPWVAVVHERLGSTASLPQLDFVQGAHLILKQAAPSGVYYVESPADRRVVFVMPWQEHTLVGTTETVLQGAPAHVQPTQHEIDYLRKLAHFYFPYMHDEVMGQFAGVRVLSRGDKGLFDRPRDTLYFTDTGLPGYIALIGGKLTAYRATAEQVIKMMRRYLPSRRALADTRELKLVRAPHTLM